MYSLLLPTDVACSLLGWIVTSVPILSLYLFRDWSIDWKSLLVDACIIMPSILLLFLFFLLLSSDLLHLHKWPGPVLLLPLSPNVVTSYHPVLLLHDPKLSNFKPKNPWWWSRIICPVNKSPFTQTMVTVSSLLFVPWIGYSVQSPQFGSSLCCFHHPELWSLWSNERKFNSIVKCNERKMVAAWMIRRKREQRLRPKVSPFSLSLSFSQCLLLHLLVSRLPHLYQACNRKGCCESALSPPPPLSTPSLSTHRGIHVQCFVISHCIVHFVAFDSVSVSLFLFPPFVCCISVFLV